MRPILFYIPLGDNGAVPVPALGFMVFLAFLIALWIGYKRVKPLGVPWLVTKDMGMYAFVGGVLGARALYLYWHPPSVYYDQLWIIELLRFRDGGFNLWGGIGGALLVLWLYARSYGLPLGKILNGFAPAILIGLAVGYGGVMLGGGMWGRLAEPDALVSTRLETNERVLYQHVNWLEDGSMPMRMERAGYSAERIATLVRAYEAMDVKRPQAADWRDLGLPLPVYPAVGVMIVLLLLAAVGLFSVERLADGSPGALALLALQFYSLLVIVVGMIRGDTDSLSWTVMTPDQLVAGVVLVAVALIRIALSLRRSDASST